MIIIHQVFYERHLYICGLLTLRMQRESDYINNWIEQSSNAYDDDLHSIACRQGIVERLVFGVAEALVRKEEANGIVLNDRQQRIRSSLAPRVQQ